MTHLHPHQVPPDAPPTRRLDRRTVLRGGVGVGAAVVAGTAVSACSIADSDAESHATALLPHAQAAFRQQRTATDLAPRATEYTAALQVIAKQRGEHLTALRDEINRLHSSIARQIESAQRTPTASVEAFRTELAASAVGAGKTAVSLDGFAAGLLGSISASCQTLAKVQLA